MKIYEIRFIIYLSSVLFFYTSNLQAQQNERFSTFLNHLSEYAELRTQNQETLDRLSVQMNSLYDTENAMSNLYDEMDEFNDLNELTTTIRDQFNSNVRSYLSQDELDISELRDFMLSSNGLIDYSYRLCSSNCEYSTRESQCQRLCQNRKDRAINYTQDTFTQNYNPEHISDFLRDIRNEFKASANQLSSKLQESRSDLNSFHQNLRRQRLEIQSQINNLREELAQFDLRGLEKEVDSFSRDLESQLLDANILMLDTSYLINQLDLNTHEANQVMETLLDQFSDQLDHTLFGKYLDQKLKDLTTERSTFSDHERALINLIESHDCALNLTEVCAPGVGEHGGQTILDGYEATDEDINVAEDTDLSEDDDPTEDTDSGEGDDATEDTDSGEGDDATEDTDSGEGDDATEDTDSGEGDDATEEDEFADDDAFTLDSEDSESTEETEADNFGEHNNPDGQPLTPPQPPTLPQRIIQWLPGW